IFVLPSHEEGFSNALIEAMSAGLPIVATDVGGNSEAIEDGVSGIIVPPRNPPAIAAAVEVVAHCRDLRMRLGVAARNRVREKFSLDSCVDAYDALYRSLE
ncbi:MAG: glycosyltransferase, partial [Lysobacterales bacterium]